MTGVHVCVCGGGGKGRQPRDVYAGEQVYLPPAAQQSIERRAVYRELSSFALPLPPSPPSLPSILGTF
jgi:hypothetical protein